MKIYSEKMKDSISRVINEGYSTKPRGIEIKELLNYTMAIDPRNCIADLPGRKFPWSYLLGETVWYGIGIVNVDYISNFSSFWKKITNENGDANSNYGYLVFHKKNEEGKTQFEWALDSLKKDKDSRQAIIHYNQTGHQIDGVKDFPCTMYQQFFIRDNKLVGLSYMRSNDVFRGTTFDLPWFSIVQQSLFLELKETYPELELGVLCHNASSYHIYQDFFDISNGIIEEQEEGKKEGFKDYAMVLNKSFNQVIKDGIDEKKKNKALTIKNDGSQREDVIEFLEDEFGIKINGIKNVN